MSTGYLKVIVGSMFSGKTTELIKEYNRHKSCGFECMVINHKFDDNRILFGTSKTASHDKMAVNSVSCTKLKPLISRLTKDEVDVYFINEGQFFDDLYEWVNVLVNHWHKKVYVCGLDGDFQRKKFGSILDIIPLCDDIIKLKAICKNCKHKEGIFTHRLSNETKQTVIGCDNYTSLCRTCYNRKTSPKKAIESSLNAQKI